MRDRAMAPSASSNTFGNTNTLRWSTSPATSSGRLDGSPTSNRPGPAREANPSPDRPRLRAPAWGLAPDNRPLRRIRPTRPLDGLPRRSLSARSHGAPYPDPRNRSERLLRQARELRRDLSVQSEGWILGGGVVFTTSRRRTVQQRQERCVAFGGCRSAC